MADSDRPDRSDLPVPRRTLDRSAVERVLARAAELQATGADASGGTLSEAEIIDAAREAGLSVEHVRQALAEERTRVVLPAEQGLAARLAGPGRAAASRVVAGSPERAIAALVQWMEREECMRTTRRGPDRASWEPRRDFVGNLLRGLRAGSPTLHRVGEVTATVAPVDGSRVLVHVEADASQGRRARLAIGGVTAATGVVAGGTVLGVGSVAHALVAVFVPLALVPMAAGAGVAWALARGHRTEVERTQRALEALLDRLEHDFPAPSSTGPGWLHVVRRALG